MDKKLETKRLLIYLAFAFGVTWIVFFAYILSGNKWSGEASGMDQFISIAMLCPALAMLLTRYVTKEGFAVTGEDSMMLGIRFRDGKWIYFVMALLLPWIYLELGNGLVLLFSPGAFDVDYPSLMGLTEQEQVLIYIQPFLNMISAVLVSFGAFGEEAGWRGYMMPKMIKLMGYKKAVIIGGILWGMWHWPLTYVGHNFGTGYFGYPFTGFAAMCLMCMFNGIILTFVTCKSGSLWTAVILHAVNNTSPSIVRYFINSDKLSGWQADSVASSLLSSVPMMVVGGILFVKEMNRHPKSA
ncbi:MAG: CPBP family intramembrane metalloprotease [Clostridium sp.]|nr:CPBP family intramembrane metalloprotease [Clostridium sp.]